MSKTAHKSPNPAHARKKSRRLAMQALYQWTMSGDNLNDIELQFQQKEEIRQVDRDYFHELLHRIPGCVDELDKALAAYLDRDMDAVDPVERAILRIGTYELLHRLDIPYRVVINEAVQLGKTFGAVESYRFINGIMDQAARQLRKTEIKASK